MTTKGEIAIIIAIGAFGAFAGGQRARILHLEAEVAAVQVRAANLAATLDTSRAINDSTARRLVAQVEETRDAQTQAAGWAGRVVALEAALRIAGHGSVTAPVTVAPADTTVRMATFSVDSVPLRATIDVALPPAPRPGSMAISWRLDTLMLAVDVGCRPDGAPEVEVRAPAWARVAAGPGRVAVGVCRPAASPPPARVGFVQRALPVAAGTVAGALATVLEGGRILPGAVAGAVVGLAFAVTF